MDFEGRIVEGNELGLLLYKGGTVCDDLFNSAAADAICKQINSSNFATTWISGNRFDIQKNLEIKLDDVTCEKAEWESCSYISQPDVTGCNHGEDVFLACSSSENKCSF